MREVWRLYENLFTRHCRQHLVSRVLLCASPLLSYLPALFLYDTSPGPSHLSRLRPHLQTTRGCIGTERRNEVQQLSECYKRESKTYQITSTHSCALSCRRLCVFCSAHGVFLCLFLVHSRFLPDCKCLRCNRS